MTQNTPPYGIAFQSRDEIEPWVGQCPLCPYQIDNLTAAGHLIEHDISVCGISANGLSYQAVAELGAFVRRLEARREESCSSESGAYATSATGGGRGGSTCGL